MGALLSFALRTEVRTVLQPDISEAPLHSCPTAADAVPHNGQAEEVTRHQQPRQPELGSYQVSDMLHYFRHVLGSPGYSRLGSIALVHDPVGVTVYKCGHVWRLHRVPCTWTH